MKALWTNKALICLLTVGLFLGTVFAEDEVRKNEAREIVELLFRFQPDLAHEKIATAKTLGKELGDFFNAWCFHQHGEYQKVLDLLTPLKSSDLPADPMLQNRFVELKASAEQLVHFKVLDTRHFSIRYKEGKDAVLTYFLPDVLESFYDYYALFFGFQQDERILVEIMPDHELFSYACALTKKQIETTGTVALCVENRLAMITPRRVLMGYDWAHVLSHEFIHYILNKQTKNHAPLWFQEGVAKAFESNWDTEKPKALDPGLAHSLAVGFDENRLVTMEEMHPSFAALPTPELASRAYAQVASMVDYLTVLKGKEIIPQFSRQLADVPNLEILFEKELDVNFEEFQVRWRAWAEKQGYKRLPQYEYHKTRLLDNDGGEESLTLAPSKSSEETPNDSSTKASPQKERERKYRRLGDLLLERDRFQAALVEYEKSREQVQEPKQNQPMDRQLILRFLKCYRSLAFYELIDRLITQEIDSLENDSTMLQFKAESLWHQKKNEEALAMLKKATRINPFDPNVFDLQKMFAHDLNDSAMAEQAEIILGILNNN